MTDFQVGDHIKFAGGLGEITKIEDRPNGGHLLHVYTTEGQLRKLPSGLPHIERIDSIVDRLAAKQIDSPIHYDLRERATRLDLAYRYDRFLSLTTNPIEIESVQATYEILNSYDPATSSATRSASGRPSKPASSSRNSSLATALTGCSSWCR